MGRENKLSIVGQVKKEIDSKLAIGESKHQAKIQGTAQDHIYSWSTRNTYLKHGCNFVKWAKQEHGCKTLEQARSHVNEYIESRSHLSAYTLKLDASALAKVYGCSTREFIKTESRHREDIIRSRGEKVRDRNFSEERNRSLVDFCKSTGLRRSELETIRGNQLVERNGEYYIKDVVGKGGRVRDVLVIGNKENVIDVMRNSGSERAWSRVHNAADIHGYRAEYATERYNMVAREREDIPKEDRYYCRNDLKGVVYDKQAMRIVTESLGHSRISVIAGHYIRA